MTKDNLHMEELSSDELCAEESVSTDIPILGENFVEKVMLR